MLRTIFLECSMTAPPSASSHHQDPCSSFFLFLVPIAAAAACSAEPSPQLAPAAPTSQAAGPGGDALPFALRQAFLHARQAQADPTYHFQSRPDRESPRFWAHNSRS